VGCVKLTLQILLSNLDIPQCHPNGLMTQKLHQRRETYSEAYHFGCIGMSELVASHAVRAFRSFGGTRQCDPETAINAGAAVEAGQEKARKVGHPGVNRFCAQRQNPADHVSGIIIDGNQAFGVKLAEWNVQRPLVLPHRSQTVRSEVNTFSDPHSGGAGEEERMGEQIVTASEFLFQPLIIFRGEGPWKISRQRREILGND
jgi:hypothetical protein